MVSEPSGLLTSLERFSALRTLSRIIGAWALGISLVFIAQDAVASDRTILVFGDSLSAALGLRPSRVGWSCSHDGFVTRLRVRSRQRQRKRGNFQWWPAASAASPRTASSRRSWSWSWVPTTACAGCRWMPCGQPCADGLLSEQLRRLAWCFWASASRRTTGRAMASNSQRPYRHCRQNHLPLVPFLLKDVALKPASCSPTACTRTRQASPCARERLAAS